jgi:hypothetical protein
MNVGRHTYKGRVSERDLTSESRAAIRTIESALSNLDDEVADRNKEGADKQIFDALQHDKTAFIRTMNNLPEYI